MNKDQIVIQIKRLIDEAYVIAPAITLFEKNRNYGGFSDADLDLESFGVWKIESKMILLKLSEISLGFNELYQEYLQVEDESYQNYCQSIFAHQIKQFLVQARTLLASPLLAGENSETKVQKEEFDFEPNYAFIAMPMDPEDHALIDVLEAIKEIANKCGVQAERVDEPQSNERITDRILESICRAEYVIVDLTNSRPNVFFEAGYAHGIGKTPIYFAKQSTKLEFDLKDYPVIFYKNLKELKELLGKRLRALRKII